MTKFVVWFLSLLLGLWTESPGYPMDVTYHIQEEIRLPAIKNSNKDWNPEVSSAKEFSEILVNTYFEQIHKEIPPQFREDPEFWRATHVSVKVIFSTFTETLLYLYPDDRNRIVADVIPFPIQIAFLGGVIDLNAPLVPTDTSSLKLFVPLEDARKYYAATPTSLINHGSRIGIAGSGTVRFVNAFKIITFEKNSIFGFFGGWLEIDNTDPAIAKMYGKPVHFRFQTLGPLLFTGEKDFSWAKQDAKTIAESMASDGVKNFFTKSEFFKQALTHEKLKPQADVILKMKARSDEDPNFDYPLWKFKQDWDNLKAHARAQGYDPDYLDALRQSRPPGTGYLFWYYPTYEGFIWQWLAANCVLLAALSIVFALKSSAALPASTLSLFQSNALGKPLLLLLVAGINGYVFALKPASLGLVYWILPGFLAGVCMVLAILF